MEIFNNLNIVSWYLMSLNNFLKTKFSEQIKLPWENDSEFINFFLQNMGIPYQKMLLCFLFRYLKLFDLGQKKTYILGNFCLIFC